MKKTEKMLFKVSQTQLYILAKKIFGKAELRGKTVIRAVNNNYPIGKNLSSWNFAYFDPIGRATDFDELLSWLIRQNYTVEFKGVNGVVVKDPNGRTVSLSYDFELTGQVSLALNARYLVIVAVLELLTPSAT